MKLFPQDTPERFEFHKVLNRLERYAQSERGKTFARELMPDHHVDTISEWLNQTHEAKEIVSNGIFFPDYQFPDVRRELGKLRIENAVLEGQEAIKILKLAGTTAVVIKHLGEKSEELPALKMITEGIYSSKELVALIDNILEPNGFIRTRASKELGLARKALSEARTKTNKAFEAMVRKYKKLGWLRDYDESFYNDRRVLAVLAEYKRQIDGTLHGSSESGSTAYIEPMQLVQLNNDVAEARQREQKEEYRILKALTDELRPYHDLIQSYERTLGFLDFTFSKARLGLEMGASKPIISRHKKIFLRDAYHPILLLQNRDEGKPTIPLTLNLDPEKRILVISGPNAGGKSISLKTMGLLQIIFQSGLLVPAHEESRMGIFRQLFVDIGDDQSIAYELSTYSSRLLKMKHFLEFAQKQTLFFIDEFGTGSDPELGGAIAEVILEELAQTKAFGVITTHYANIKIMAEDHSSMLNACMLFDEKTLLPKYQLQVGIAGSSYTFEVAQKIGLKDEIVERAKKKLDDKKVKFDQLLITLQTKKNQLNKETSILQREKSQVRKEIESSKKVAQTYQEKAENLNFEENKRLIEKGKKFEQFIENWKVKKNRKELSHKLTLAAEKEASRKREAAEARKEREKKERIAKQKANKKERAKALQEMREVGLKPGDEVKMRGTRQVGVIDEVSKGKATVVFGMVRTIVPIEKLELKKS